MVLETADSSRRDELGLDYTHVYPRHIGEITVVETTDPAYQGPDPPWLQQRATCSTRMEQIIRIELFEYAKYFVNAGDQIRHRPALRDTVGLYLNEYVQPKALSKRVRSTGYDS